MKSLLNQTPFLECLVFLRKELWKRQTSWWHIAILVIGWYSLRVNVGYQRYYLSIENLRYTILDCRFTNLKTLSLICEDSLFYSSCMKEIIKKRAQKFAGDVWRFCEKLPHSREYNAYVRQMIRSSSSVGANYRAAQRGKSKADFIYKLKIVEEEADETLYFLELLAEVNPLLKKSITPIYKEGNEILSIIVASIKTARNRNKS